MLPVKCDISESGNSRLVRALLFW